MEAKGATAGSLGRKCVVVRWADLKMETLLDLVERGAGSLLLLLPQNFSDVHGELAEVRESVCVGVCVCGCVLKLSVSPFVLYRLCFVLSVSTDLSLYLPPSLLMLDSSVFVCVFDLSLTVNVCTCIYFLLPPSFSPPFASHPHPHTPLYAYNTPHTTCTNSSGGSWREACCQ